MGPRTPTTQRPRRAIAGPLLRGSGELHIVGRHEVVTLVDPDGAVQRLLVLADGSRARAEIHALLIGEFPGLAWQDVDAALSELVSIGVLEECAPSGHRLLLGGRPGRRDRHGPAPWARAR